MFDKEPNLSIEDSGKEQNHCENNQSGKAYDFNFEFEVQNEKAHNKYANSDVLTPPSNDEKQKGKERTSIYPKFNAATNLDKKKKSN